MAEQAPRGPRCVLCGRPGYLHGPEFNPLTGRGLLVDGATGLRCAAVASCSARVGENRRSAPRRYSFTRDQLIDALTRLDLHPGRDAATMPMSARFYFPAGQMADAIIKALEGGQSAAREGAADG